MPEKEPTRPISRPVRRWIRRLALAMLVLLTATGAGIYYLVQPQRLAAITEGVLQSILPGSVASIGSVDFSWDGRVELNRLELRVRGMDGPGADLFKADKAEVRLSPSALLRGKVELHLLRVSKPVLSLTQIGEDRFNIDALREAAQKDAPTKPPATLPKIELIEGRVAFGEIAGDRYVQGPSLYLAGAFSADTSDASRYLIDFFEYDPLKPATPQGASLKGWFTPRDLGLAVELSNFDIASPHRLMLPRQVRSWWDMFQPRGRVSLVRVEHDTHLGARALVNLDGVSLTFAQLSTADYAAHMTDVSARFRFDADTIRVESLVGEIEGLRYKIAGEIGGYRADSPFRFTLETQPFEIPEKPRYIPAFPDAVQNVFRMLTPVGWMKVALATERREAGGPIDYHGAAQILSGQDVTSALAQAMRPTESIDPLDPRFSSRGKYRKFPYEVFNVKGLITFDTQAVRVEQLLGDTAGGGTLSITGTIAPPQAQAEAHVDLVIRAANIPFDDALYSAMQDKHRQATLMFFHEPSWKELHAKGHFITEEERATLDQSLIALREQIARVGEEDPEAAQALNLELRGLTERASLPVFELGGKCNAVVLVKGSAGDNARPDIELALDLFDANVVFEHFKYPLKVHRGRLLLDKGRAIFDNAAATGLHGGRGRLDGELDLPDKSAGLKVVPRLGLLARGFPIDGLLFDVLGDDKADWLRGLNLTGNLDVEGTIFRDTDADRIEADMAVVITDGAARPGRGGYLLQAVGGRLTVGLRHVAIEHITAKHGGADFTLTGEADWSPDQPPTLQVHATGTGLDFSDGVLDLVRITARQNDAIDAFWQRWKPSGRFDFDVDYSTGAQGRDYTLQLRPDGLSFEKEPHRITLSDTSGSIVVQPTGFRLEGLGGHYDGGSLQVSGEMGFDSPRMGLFNATASGNKITPAFTAMLPVHLAGVLRGLAIEGAYELDIPTLRLRPDAQSEPAMEIAATLKLDDASMQLGVPITGFHGRAVVAGVVDPGREHPTMRVVLSASSLYAASRQMTDLEAELGNEDGSPQVRLSRLSARLAGGQLSGEGHGRLDRGDYAVRLVLANALLADLTVSSQAQDPAPDTAEQREPLTGRLSASLDVEGSWRDPGRMRGRGDMALRGGNFRGLPLAYGLLRITHLALPTSNPFDTAAISYYLTPDKVDFGHIELSSPETRLSGKGLMTLPDTKLNIALTTSNVKGLKLGPLTELINKFRDQLVTLHITGTLDKPVVKTRQFYGVAEAWREIFGEEPPKPMTP